MESYDLPPDSSDYEPRYLPPSDFHTMSWTAQLAMDNSHVSCGGGGGDEDHEFSSSSFEPQRAQPYPYNPAINPSRAILGPDWHFQVVHAQSQQQQPPFTQTEDIQQQFSHQFPTTLPQTSTADFAADTQANLDTTYPIYTAADSVYMSCPPAMDQINSLAYYQGDLQNSLAAYTMEQQIQPGSYHSDMLGTSPDDSSCVSEGSWQIVDDQMLHSGSINPLSIQRTPSDSSQVCSWDEMQFPPSPRSEVVEWAGSQYSTQMQSPQNTYLQLGGHDTSPVPSHTESATSTSISSPVSPNRMPSSPARKKKESKVSKPAVKKPTPAAKKEIQAEKKVGRRKGPLRPEQRKQAGEIRKLRACLRCKFLKKTCDKGDPCAGCKPSHARLWQVPCTRIDIKEIGYFMKNWDADYARHLTLNVSAANVRSFSKHERALWVTHGYGIVLPIQAREIFVHGDDDMWYVDWTESKHEKPKYFDHPTARLSTGSDGIPRDLLQEYLDRHIDGGFESFVDKHFEQTEFLTEMLKTAYHYYLRTKLPVMRKALKLVLAYNLTQHLTFLEGVTDEECLTGKVEDPESNFEGRVLAPIVINFQIKTALAFMWRDLQASVLEEFQSLCQSVYNGAKLKHWPTIFMLAVVLLIIWEEMQFDSHYRAEYENDDNVLRFCREMESTPVGVVVGLFSAISQKVPSFQEWDTRKHHHIMNSDQDVCDTITEVHDHVLKYQDYLKSRSNCMFDREDFDCLSNKFLAKLVIRQS